MATSEATETEQHDLPGGDRGFREDVVRGLSSDPKWLPTRFIYDRRGREYYEMICRQPAWYLREAEEEIYGYFGAEIARSLGSAAVLVQWGPASESIVFALLDNMEEPSGYVGLGPSGEMMQPVVDAVGGRYPALRPVFISSPGALLGALPESVLAIGENRVVFCPGSAIGDCEPEEAQALLKSFQDAVGAGGKILVGVDLEKPKDVVEAAYRDKAQIVDRFHLNLLQRANREAGTNFDLMKFRFGAEFDEKRQCMEMFVISMASQEVTVDGQTFRVANNERIRTQISYKYSQERFQMLAHETGANATQLWMDSGRRFSAYLLEST